MRVSLLLLAALALCQACTQKERPVNTDLTLVEGGPFVNIKSNLYGRSSLPDFYIGKYEVTQREWTRIMGTNPSRFKGEKLPVENVSWYDCVEYSNKRSVMEGLEPYYIINKTLKDTSNKSEFDGLKFTVKVNSGAKGYRLPSEAEWEYAASGGQRSKNYDYSGSNDISEVAWYWKNSGEQLLSGSWIWAEIEKNHCSTKPAGSKKANELGLFDMSGNVREWCEDWYQDSEMTLGLVRSQRGGGWMGAEQRCSPFNRHSFEASGKGPDQGFRVCRSL